MATNEILRFAETDTGTNLLTQAEYLADSQRPIGNQPGVARSKLVNKALRQSSLIAAAVAQFIADNQANNVVDTANPADIADWIEAAVRSIGIPTALAGGTADAITADFTPNVSLTNGTTVIVRAGAANTTTTPTFSPDGLTAKTIVKGNNLALVAGDIAGAGHWLELQYDATLDKWVLQNPAFPIGAVTAKQIQSVSATVAANALTLGLAATALDFRNASLPSGAPVPSVAVGALSLVVPSGATLGTVNAQSARLVLLVAYNAGSPVLCVANLAGGVNLDETTLISPTTISGASNSASVIYSASAVAANSPFRVVGFVDITEATAGTWATAPSAVQGIGGQALAAMSSIGYGQTWQTVTRTSGVTYYNTTGRPIIVSVYTASLSGGSGTVSASINGGSAIKFSVGPSAGEGAGSIVVPPGASYMLTDNVYVSTRSTYELR